jgi:FKBP-type peptidyl-prolyl cis-trans isomerase
MMAGVEGSSRRPKAAGKSDAPQKVGCVLRANQENTALTILKAMKTIILSVICLASATPVLADGTNALATEKDRTSYAIGMNMGASLKQNFIDVDDALFLRGLQDAQGSGPKLMTEEEMHQVLMQLQQSVRAKQQERMAEAGAKNKADGAAFLAANKNNPGVVTQPDGLQYQILNAGTGPMPTAGDTVTVNYSGTLLDGTEFDSSYKRGKPISFPVTGVIRGWTEALQMMPEGSKWKLFIPSDLAYGPQGRPGIPPNATLIFQVELLAIKPPAAPAVSAPSAPLTSDIIKVPSAEEMKKGAKIEVIKPEDAAKMQSQTNQ